MQRTAAPVAAALMALTPAASGQENKVLTIDDYGQWKSIRSVELSHDGDWFAYALDPNEGDPTLYLEPIDGGDIHEIPNGAAPEFARGGRHAAYLIRPGDDERGGTTKMVLLDLGNGDKAEYDNIQRFEFSEDGRYLLVTKSRPERGGSPEHSGRDTLLITLDGRDQPIVRHLGSVAEAEFSEDEPEHLAYVIDAADMAGNGLYLLELDGDNALTPLATSQHRYADIAWGENGERLAVMRGRTPDGMSQRENEILAWETDDTRGGPILRFDLNDATENGDVPDRMVISQRGDLEWSEDGEILFFGLDEQETDFMGSISEQQRDELPNVDVWHWEDDQPQSVQEVRANYERNRTFLSAVVIDDADFVTLADEAMRSVSITGEGRWGLGRDDSAYRGRVTWGGSPADYYRIDLETGNRELIAREISRPIGTSPCGRWFLFLEDERVIAYDMDADREHDLTRASGVDFVDRDDDHPYELPVYGRRAAGWVEGEDGDALSVILNHKFDLYEIELDGDASRNLTNGMGEDEQIRFDIVTLDPDAEYVDLDGRVLLSAYGEWTKKSGFFELDPGRDPDRLVFTDHDYGRPIKARDDERIAITRQTFEHFPDYYLTDTDFSTFDRLTDANPQIEEYAWGRRVLIDYENSDGVPLQATLTLPPDYEPGEEYPMLVYFYEKMSQRHHQFSMPRYDDRPHMSTYASDGYLVLMPDVVYEPGSPGDSAVDCVTSAVQEVIDRGYADPDRVGLQGHSWGGYQSSYILTQTDMFAAIVTGAPVTNLVSFYNELYKRTGTIQHGIVEVGQVRMGTTPFEDFDRFVDQSPVHNAENISTPFVILHGTADGAVDWHQGLELYASARRLGKPSVLLSYPDEPHHLRDRANQIDFQIRMKQFFDHHLKGEDPPDWWTEGVPYLKKNRYGPEGEREVAQERGEDESDDTDEAGPSRRGQSDASDRPARRTRDGRKPTLEPEDYGQWERIGRRVLSNDGRWLAYQVRRVDRHSELRLKDLEDLDAEPETFEFASRPEFTPGGDRLGFLIGVHPDQAEKRREQNKPVRTTLGLYDTDTGELVKIEAVRSFAFSEDGEHLAYARYPANGGGGANLIVRDLETGVETTFGDVAEYAWSPEDAILAMTIDTTDEVGNGVCTYDPGSGSFRTLDSAHTDYRGLTWHDDEPHLAVMREAIEQGENDESDKNGNGKDGGKDNASNAGDPERTHDVIAWRDLDRRSPTRNEWVATDHPEFDAETRVVEYEGIEWADHGEAIFFGTQARDAVDKKNDDGDDENGESLRDTIDEPSNVEVWHADDIDIIPFQKVRERQFERENHLAAFWLGEEDLVMVESDLTEDARMVEGHRHAIGLDNTPYEQQRKFGPTLYDAYIVDLETGERERFLEEVKYVWGSSPDGQTVLYQRGGHAWAYHIEDDEHVNLTRRAPTEFENQENSTLTDEKPLYGVGGWSEDGDTVYLYDRYDIYAFEADGSGYTRLTEGAADRVRHRLISHDPDGERVFDTDEPAHVSHYGDTTKRWGFGTLELDPDADGSPRVRTLILEAQNLTGLSKAEDAGVYIYNSQDFDDPPDVFMARGLELDDPQQVTELNPQHDDYAWGRSELIDFESDRGEPLQGALHYPADYDPDKQYPMLVYIYELRSQNLRNYPIPSETSSYNFATFTQEGYFVYQPDIVYRAQNPGLSAVECVVPAVETVLDRVDSIDPDRVGLVGHSWGAYQTAFIVTQTDLFAAGVAGAPLTNMMSMSMSIYWNSGQTDAWIFHESQGRMDRPFWRDVDTYIANSPIFNIDDMDTPLLISFGTEDGAVDFNQGVEMYNAARLAEKDLVMLVYPGENHSVRRRENQVDYHYKILDWFGHYVKGEDPADWITEGKPWLERQKEIEAMNSGD